MIPLEDFFNDVVGKAQRGLGLTNEALAEKADVTVAQIVAVKDGTKDTATLLKISPVLGLHGPAEALARDPRVIDTYLGAARRES